MLQETKKLIKRLMHFFFTIIGRKNNWRKKNVLQKDTKNAAALPEICVTFNKSIVL